MATLSTRVKRFTPDEAKGEDVLMDLPPVSAMDPGDAHGPGNHVPKKKGKNAPNMAELLSADSGYRADPVF